MQEPGKPVLASEMTPLQTTFTSTCHESSLKPDVGAVSIDANEDSSTPDVLAILIDESGEVVAAVVVDAVIILMLPRGTYAAGSVDYNK
jgi:hypothetical protein